MTAQIVEIAGQQMAMLPIREYQILVDIAEDKTDTLAAEDAFRRRAGGEEYLPSDMMDRLLAGEPALRVWRKYRGLTQDELGGRIGCAGSFLSMIESGKRDASAALWRKLADSLGTSIDDIIPLAHT